MLGVLGKERFCTRSCWLITIPVRKVPSSAKLLWKRCLLKLTLTCLYHLCFPQRLNLAFTQDLKSLIFSLGLPEALMTLVVAPEQFGDLKIKLVLSNLKVQLWLFYVRRSITRNAGISI